MENIKGDIEIPGSIYGNHIWLSSCQLIIRVAHLVLSINYSYRSICYSPISNVCNLYDDVVLMGYIMMLFSSAIGISCDVFIVETVYFIKKFIQNIKIKDFFNKMKDKKRIKIYNKFIKYYHHRQIRIQTISCFVIWMNGIVFGMFGIIIWFLQNKVIKDDYPFEAHCIVPPLIFFIIVFDIIKCNIVTTYNTQRLLMFEYKEKLNIDNKGECKIYKTDGEVLTCDYKVVI